MNAVVVSSSYRRGFENALGNPHVIALAAVVGIAEVVVRTALAFVHPLFSVVFPPVVTTLAFGASMSEKSLSGGLRAYGSRLTAAATICHGVALCLGASLFLLIDTPLRFAFYVVDGGVLPWNFVYAAPLIGVCFGVSLVWGPLVAVVARVAEGDSLTVAFETAVSTALNEPRRTAAILCLHLVAVSVVGGIAFVGLTFASQSRSILPLIVVAGCVLLAGVLTLGVLYSIHSALAEATPDNSKLPTRNVVLAFVIVTAAVVGAGTIRVTEFRPDPALEPLPDDPDGMYATALENTGQTSFDVTYIESRPGRAMTVRWAVDRTDRRQLMTSNASGFVTGYTDAGVAYRVYDLNEYVGLGTVADGAATVLPAYWLAQSEVGPDGVFALPPASTGEWRVVNESGDTVTLELTDGDAVFDAFAGGHPKNVTYEASRIRIRVDTQRRVVTGGSLRLNASFEENDIDVRSQYRVETGDNVSIDRPAELGPRHPTEWVWKLFAY